MPTRALTKVRRKSPTNADLYELIVEQDHRLDRLESRINYLFGGLAVLVTIANFIAPVIVRDMFK